MPYPDPRDKEPRPGELLEAATRGEFYEVQRLLERRANFDERDIHGNTPLHRAAYFGSIEIVRLLIEKGANMDARNNQGETPLMSAAMCYNYNREAVAGILLKAGANMDIKDNHGSTATSIAKQRQRTQLVKMLDDTAAERKKLAEEFAKAAAEKRRADMLERQRRLQEQAKKSPRPKPGPGPKPIPPEAA
jgi:ankyrin repeat protein